MPARKKTKPYTFLLKLDGRNPDQVPMEHVGEYVRLFAEMLGATNCPQYRDLIEASTGIPAYVPHQNRERAKLRLFSIHRQPNGRPAHAMRGIERLMGEDGFPGATVKTEDGQNLLRLVPIAPRRSDEVVIYQSGTVDGEVTGILGSDDSMTLHLRDSEHRDVRLVVNNVALAKRFLPYWRTGTVRVHIRGDWARTDCGWFPEKTCVVDDFEPLSDAPLSEILQALIDVPGNGWKALKNPMAAWMELRGES